MSKPQRSSDPEVVALVARMPADEAWAIVAYLGRPGPAKTPAKRKLVASSCHAPANLPRQITLDMPDDFVSCTLVGWSVGVDPGELGF